MFFLYLATFAKFLSNQTRQNLLINIVTLYVVKVLICKASFAKVYFRAAKYPIVSHQLSDDLCGWTFHLIL